MVDRRSRPRPLGMPHNTQTAAKSKSVTRAGRTLRNFAMTDDFFHPRRWEIPLLAPAIQWCSHGGRKDGQPAGRRNRDDQHRPGPSDSPGGNPGEPESRLNLHDIALTAGVTAA